MNKISRIFGICAISALAIGFLFVAPAINAQNDYTYTTQEATVTTGNVYAADNDLTITQDVLGDLVVAGGVVTIKGNVSGNLIVAGGAVQVDGSVSGDALVTAGVAVINGTIGGDLRVFAGQGYLNGKVIGSDLIFFVGEGGIVQGVSIGGLTKLSTDVVTSSTSNLVDISYYRNQWKDSLDSMKSNRRTSVNRSSELTFSVIAWIVGILGSLIAGYMVLRLFPVLAETTFVKMRKDPIVSMLVGSLALFLSVFMGIILIVSIIGWYALFIMFTLFVLILILADIYSKYVVGRIMLEKLNMPHRGRLQTLLFGLVVVGLAGFIFSFIPVLGNLVWMIISFLLSMWALGAMLLNKIAALQSKSA